MSGEEVDEIRCWEVVGEESARAEKPVGLPS